MGIKRIFFSLLAISLLWLFDLIPRSIKYLGGTGVITSQLGHHPLGGWRTCQKNEKGFQGDLLGEWLVHELKIRPLHGAIYWFAQVFLHRRGAPGCSSSGTVASSQPSTRSAGVLLPWFLILWSSASSVKYFAHSRLEREVIIGEKYFLTVVDKERKKQQQKKRALNEDDPVDYKNYLWRFLNNQKLQFVFSICSQGKVIWFISVKCWRDESQSNKSHFSNLSLHIREGIISFHLKGIFSFFFFFLVDNTQ